ncbi:MAG TPA: hypothetical protein VND19_24620 [Acetobacteraceae bacterium]|nr:hypothetical protein [Acetobacteraceae bacterium]
MTAEVAVLNKLGVALAADSIVTITSNRGDKTYNTSNKLFTLSKFHPVGILTYGSVEVDTLPVEIAIKEFREKLHDASRPKLEDYSSEFVEFLASFTPSDDKTDRRNFAAIAADHADTIKQRFNRECRSRKIARDRSGFTVEMEDALDKVLARLRNGLAKAGRFAQLAHITQLEVDARYGGIIERAINEEFDGPPLGDQKASQMAALISEWILSNRISDASCGIVVAGYGSEQHYPGIIEHEVEGKIFGILKISTDDPTRIDHENQSIIRAYAQRNAAQLFMCGVDPGYQRFIDDGVAGLLPGLASEVAAHFSVADPDKIEALRKIFENKATDFIASMADRRHDHFVKPLYDTVDFLDKPELAALAENLVSLTALKQKISLDLETVGGPIDVAVISKHDGFIWIKRKHYFSADLNHSYITNYLKPRR